MNIDKYIKNTKRKTKKAKLPALSTMTPIMPDGAAGIPTFNSYVGGDAPSAGISEELTVRDIDKIKSSIESKSKSFMEERGFSKDELDDVLNIEFVEKENIFTINIYADLTISSLRELADTLYDIVSEYDEDAYFDISTNSSISVDLEMGKNLSEAFQRLDRIGFDRYCEDYGFETLYESMKTKLNSEDRTKLQKFLQTTDDPEEVNVYMKGLLLEEADEEEDYDLYDDFDTEYDEFDDFEADEYEDDTMARIDDTFTELKELLNTLTSEANKLGDDKLRSATDMTLGALDDVASYLSDVAEALGKTQLEEE